MTNVEQWAEKLKELHVNRRGRIPIDRPTEERLTKELEGIFLRLTEEERGQVERPLSPRYADRPIDLIALDGQGRLIGYEDEL